MEDPVFARGIDILLVHNDTLYLGYLTSLLRQSSFKVTATNQASAAIDMIGEQEGRFKLAIAKANLPDMSTLSFLHKFIEKEIPVIFISSGENDGVAMAAFARGLCYFLKEPIQADYLKYVCQHVYHTKNNLAEEIQNVKCKGKVDRASQNQRRTRDDAEDKQKGKRVKLGSDKMKFGSNHHTAKEEREQNKGSTGKKPRVVWTPELHLKFVEALSVLGDKNIRPKAIQLMMNVPNLTCRHVGSHLQKFKSQVKRLQETCVTNLPLVSKLSNFSCRTKSFSSFESEICQGFPTLTAFQNENQNQNQPPMNIVETQGPDIFQLQETPGNATYSFQPPTDLINYENQFLDAVVRGPVPDALTDENQSHAEYNNILKFPGEDCDKYDCFRNESSPDDTAPNSQTQRNSIIGNSSSPQQTENCNPSCVRLLKAKPSCSQPQAASHLQETGITDLPPVSKSSNFNGTKKSSSLFESQSYPGHPTSTAFQNENQNQSQFPVSFAKTQGTDIFQLQETSGYENQYLDAVVRGPEPNALMDKNQSLAEYNILKFLGEDCNEYDCFGNESSPDDTAQNSQIQLNSIIGNSSTPQQSDNCNRSYVRLLKAEPSHSQVASHLQKFKSQVRRLHEICITDLPLANKSSNFSDTTKSPSSFESPSYPGFPTSIAFQNENQNQNQSPMNFDETQGPDFFQLQETSRNATCSFQPPTDLVNYENQYLDAVVRGPVAYALKGENQSQAEYNNILKFLGEDCDKYDCFGNGTSPDDTTQNTEIQRNSILENSSNPQQSGNYNPSCRSLLKTKPSGLMGGPEPDILMDQTLTENDNILRILGKDFDEYDCFGKGPNDIAQNCDILRNSILGNSFNPQQFDNCNPSSENLLKTKSCAIVGEPMPNALMDQNQILTEHDNILRILGEDCDKYDCFGNEQSPNEIEILMNSILVDGSNPQQSDHCNTSCV